MSVENIATMFTSGEAAEAVSQAAESSVVTVLDPEFLTKYVNMDLFKSFLEEGFVPAFLIGFAFASVLVLLTYGAFKAMGLIRIKSS